MSCGQRKRPDPQPLPALQRYDGPSFQVLRRYLGTYPDAPLDIFILSAKFGLIPAARPIPAYDQRMTGERARDLLPEVRATLKAVFAVRAYDAVFMAVGRDYSHVLEGYAALAPTTASVMVGRGSQGKRLAQLHDWLYGLQTPVATGTPGTAETRRTRKHHENPRLRGVEITLTADQALAAARHAFATASHGRDRFHSWYVLIDGERIAPKWLVRQLTGLPAGAFTTQEALRILAQIGIPVHRTDVW
jgi:hypothetical protein